MRTNESFGFLTDITDIYLPVKSFTNLSKEIHFRSSRPEVFSKKGVLTNFKKFTGKDLCQSLFFDKVAGLSLQLEKRLWQMCFPVNFVKFLKTPFFIEHPRWMLLSFNIKLKMFLKVKNIIFQTLYTSLFLDRIGFQK